MKTHQLFGLIAIAAITGPALADGLPSQKFLTLDVANGIAQAALAKCRLSGDKVTITVVDGSNTMRAFLHDDGAITGGIETSRMKVYTVLAFGGRATGMPPNMPAGAPMPAPFIPGMTFLPGGVPIKVGDQLVGAISVSGASSGEQDAACATAGIEKMASALK